MPQKSISYCGVFQVTKDWKKLNDFQHARLRNEMYFGSRDPHTQVVLDYSEGNPNPVEKTWIPAVFTAFREVLDNALDEVVTHGHGSQIDVTYDPKHMIFSVKDDGRGIPINFDAEEKNYAATVLLSETKAGRNFDDRGNSRGMNGIGASVVNFCSEWFQLDIWREKKHFSQRFTEGDGNALVIEDPIILPSNSKTSGTKVSFKLSKTVFKRCDLPEDFVKARIFEVALCYPQVKVTYNGKIIQSKGVEKTLFGGSKPISISIREPNFRSQFWLIPNFMNDGAEMAHSLVNAIPTFGGGTHIEAFKRSFFAGLLSALETQSKKRRLNPVRGDIADGLLIFNITEMDSPSFDSQNKTRLINEECNVMVRKVLVDDTDFFKKVIRNYPEWIDAIYARCAERTQKKDTADTAKLAKKVLRSKVENLTDACAVDRRKCILLLTEGNSAVSGIIEARNPEIHGGLPLRGKTLNVFGLDKKTILENQELSRIMMAVGLIPGQRANRHALRYGKIAITCDADEDGKNVSALLINFFFTLWPELFEDPDNPFIYVFETPLIIAAKSKDRKYWYAHNVDEFDGNKFKGWEITRAKGLAALRREDWRVLLADPRMLPMVGDLKDSLKLIFGPDADARKVWIGK